MFDYPTDWDDDERMAFLFRDFRPREANPLGYDEKMLFWKKLVTSFTGQRREAIFNVQSLTESFTRKNSQPVCLMRVIEALRQDGVIVPRKPAGWMSWMSSWLFTPAHTAEDEVFINVKAVEEARQDVQMAIKARGYRETRVSFRDVWSTCREACDGSQDLFYVVLEKLGKISIKDNFVDFSHRSDLIKPLTEHEKALMQVRETVPKIQQKIDQLISKEESFRNNAIRLKKEGFSIKAIGELRRAKVVTRQLDKLYGVLDNLHQMETDLENQRDFPAILDSYKMATSALRTANSDVDKVHDIVDEMADAAAEQQEIQESVATGATTFSKADEDDLEEELQRILQEESEQEILPAFPSVPNEPLASEDSTAVTAKTKDVENSVDEIAAKKRVRLGYFE